MIRTLRRKFTVTAMIAVTVLLLAILGAVNGFNVLSNARETDELLLALSEGEADAGRTPPELPRGERGEEFFGRGPIEDRRMAALYFTVDADSAGAITRIELTRIASVDESEAAALYERIGTRTEGRVGSFRYRSVERADGSRTTVFLDRSLERADVLRVALLSGLAGLVGWGLMLLFVTFLSRKAIEPIAANMEKQKRFVTDAGHELKTPLAIILANTEALELREGENKYTKNIRGQVDRLSGLTQNLLALARADEGHGLTNAADFPLNELAAEIAQPFREPAELKKLTLTEELTVKTEVHADRRQLGQLIGILLDNAVKYTPEGGEIVLQTKKEGGKAVLQVKNTVADQSVPPERFFDRFFRADEARTQKSGGSGIGLSAARAIAEAHKAGLTAAYEGESIVFTLRI